MRSNGRCRMSLDNKTLWWRNTALVPRRWGMNVTAMIPLMILPFGISVTKIEIALISTIFFVILEMFRITPGEALRGFYLYVTTWKFHRDLSVVTHRKIMR